MTCFLYLAFFHFWVKNSNKKALHADLQVAIILTTDWMQQFDSASRKISFALNLAGTTFALWLKTRNNEWEVVMRVRPLLRDSRPRAKTTPVRIALEWVLSIVWEFYPMLYGLCKSISLKNIQSEMNCIVKNSSLQLAAQALMDEPE